MITMVAFTTERGNPNKIGFNLIYINLKIYIYIYKEAKGVLGFSLCLFGLPSLGRETAQQEVNIL